MMKDDCIFNLIASVEQFLIGSCMFSTIDDELNQDPLNQDPTKHFLKLITIGHYPDAFFLNGTPLDEHGSWSQIGSSQYYSFLAENISAGNYTLSSRNESIKYTATTFGYREYFAYGYVCGMSLENADTPPTTISPSPAISSN